MVKIKQSPNFDNKKGNKFQKNSGKPGDKGNKKFGKSFKPNLKGGKKEGFLKNVPKEGLLKNTPKGFQKNIPKGIQKNVPKRFEKNVPKENTASKISLMEKKNKKPEVHVKNGKAQISPKKNDNSVANIKNGKKQISPKNNNSEKNITNGEQKMAPKTNDKKSKEDIKKKNLKGNEPKKEKKSKARKLEKSEPDLIKLPTDSIEKKENVSNFNEENFLKIVNVQNVENIVKALQTKLAAEQSNAKNKMFSDYRYMLDVMCFKIPKCPKRTVKLSVKHPLVDKEGEICFISTDLERGMRVDYEPTIQHYEELFKEKGIKGNFKIIPFNQIKKEYSTYEMKLKLSNMYDYYLCDGKIAGHLHGFLGKKFRKTRSTVFAVRMNAKDLASEFKKAIQKVSYVQGESGPIISIPIGTDKFNSKQLAENVIKVVEELKTIYPGGYPNIRGMYVKANIVGSNSLPIFLSAAKAPAKTPVVIGTRETKLEALQKKIVPSFTKFVLNKAGEIVPVDKKSENEITNENVNKKRKAVDNLQSIKEKNSKKVKKENVKEEKSLSGEGKKVAIEKKTKSSTKELTKLEMLKAPELGTTSNFQNNENVEGEDDEGSSEDDYESYEEDSEEEETYEDDEEADEEGDETDLDEDDTDNSDDNDDDETEDEENENNEDEDEEDDSSDEDLSD